MENRKVKLYLKIFNDLFNKIKSGELKNGDKLPTEYELMAIYKVSRITVINAIRLLDNKKLISRQRKNGTFVNINRNLDRPVRIAFLLPYNEIFNGEILDGVTVFAESLQCDLNIYNTYNNAGLERDILETIIEDSVDGVLFYPCSTFENIDIVNRLYAKKVPLVFIDREIYGTDYSLVTANNLKAMNELVTGLIRMGYHNIGYYGINESMISTERDRFNGYCTAMANMKNPVNSDYIFEISNAGSSVDYRYTQICDDNSFNMARDFVKKNLMDKSRRPEVVVCVNDYLAVNLMHASMEAGIRVPEELGITGFDNIKITNAVKLTTIQQSLYEMGQVALDSLYKLINGEKCAKRIRVNSKLLLRDTTRPLKNIAEKIDSEQAEPISFSTDEDE